MDLMLGYRLPGLELEINDLISIQAKVFAAIRFTVL